LGLGLGLRLDPEEGGADADVQEHPIGNSSVEYGRISGGGGSRWERESGGEEEERAAGGEVGLSGWEAWSWSRRITIDSRENSEVMSIAMLV